MGVAMKKHKKPNDWVELTGSFTSTDVRALKKLGPIERLSIIESPRLTAKLAQAFASLTSVSWLWLWCDVTRTAMRHVLAIPGLKTLDVLSFTSPGKLQGFSSATSLEVIRANHYLTEADLLEMTSCSSLREIGAQNSALSPRVIEAMLNLPNLESVDLEATAFDDEMAREISRSKRLLSLDVGATRLTRQGLLHICRMQQLRSLDLWATSLEERDIALLVQLPNLEYVSIGDVEGGTKFNAESLLPRLAAMKSLQRIWLDGIDVNVHQRAQLEARFSNVRLT